MVVYLFIVCVDFVEHYPLFPSQLRVSKEQEHFLVLPDGLAYSEVTGSSLVSETIKLNVNMSLKEKKLAIQYCCYLNDLLSYLSMQ